MRFVAFALSCVIAAAGLRAQTPPAPTDLFNGKDLTGWTLVSHQEPDLAQVCHVTADGTISVAGKPVGYLLAPGTFKEYRLHLEYRWPAGANPKSNSGVLVHIASGPINGSNWPLCFQVQMKVTRAGDLLPMAGAAFAEPLSTPPGAKTPQLDRQGPNNEKPFGEWNACDVICRDGVIECAINGVRQNRVTGCKPAAGQIGIQLEGFPYELRNIRIGPIGSWGFDSPAFDR